MLLNDIFALIFSFGFVVLMKKMVEDHEIFIPNSTRIMMQDIFHYYTENYIFYTSTDKLLFSESIVRSLNRIISNVQKGFGFFKLENGENELPQKELKEDPRPIVKYEDKYLEKYKKIEVTECSEEKLNGLKNSLLMENTPLGNVMMFYDHSRGTFVYYSDSNIPYRYLEVISRKYVIHHNCKKIHVDMEKELKEAEEKIKQKKEEEQMREEEKKKKESDSNDQGKIIPPNKPSKSVFAKLKNYNKDTSLKSAGIPTDSKSVSKKIIPTENEGGEKILKENANRYSYEGKMVNFSFLKKVDKKLVDKNYLMSFSDFKKMFKKK